MLSSVSYVCLGVFAGMWVISRGIYLGMLVCLSSRSCCSSVRVIFICFWLFKVCVCVLFAFILQMFSALLCGRIFRLRFPRDPVLYNPLQVLFRMLCWLAPSTSSKYFSSYNRWRSWAWENGLTVFPASPFHFAIYLRHLMTEAKTASLPGVSSSQHCLVSPAGWWAVPFWSSVGEEYSCQCAAFAGPSNNQEGAYHSLSVRAVSCLQGGLNGLFV